jgi:hypothetical protein
LNKAWPIVIGVRESESDVSISKSLERFFGLMEDEVRERVVFYKVWPDVTGIKESKSVVCLENIFWVDLFDEKWLSCEKRDFYKV